MALRLSQNEIEAWRERESADVHHLPTFRAYASGEQNAGLNATQKQIMGSRVTHALADNVLRLVLSTAASRLELEGWKVPAEPVQQFLDTLFLTSTVGRLQYDTHFAALRDGNTAVSLRWKPGDSPGSGRVTIHREAWWDGTSGVFVGYDDYDAPAWAVREFTEIADGKEVKRRVVYYPDAIYRYRLDGGVWKPHTLPGDPPGPAPGVVPWIKRDTSPIGLPIVAFANSLADDGLYGRSDIYGLLGLQDDLNAMQRDIAAAAMFTAFQMYWMSGVDTTDASNKVGPGRLLKSASPDTKFGTLAPGDMAPLMEAHGYKRQTIAVDSSTPIHLITGGDWPSGEALLRAEMPLIDKVRRLARVLGPAWVLVAHRASEIANTFGGTQLDEASPITALFAAPERLDELTQRQVELAKVNLLAALAAIPDRTLLQLTGLLTDEQLDAVMAEREQRAERYLQTEAAF